MRNLIAAGLLAFVSFALHIPAANALPPEGEIQSYKGVTLVGTTYPKRNSKNFFRLARRAIDMVSTLPKEGWHHGSLITKIVYDPPSPHRKTKGHARNIVAVYTVDPEDSWPAPIIMYKSAKYASALQLALSLIANSFHADDHRKRARLYRELKAAKSGGKKMSQAEYDRKLAAYKVLIDHQSGRMDPDEKIRKECNIKLGVYKALKILHPEDRSINARANQLTERNCWDG